uniref:Auxin-responsive protein n=1 Tax=Pinus taeda TaxID=3352 RepID=Q7XYT4_PINTA|nr:auxin-induced protein 3 [Pinus taeda]|eukprot:PITA_32397
MSCSVGNMAMVLEKSGGNAQHEKRDSLDFAETELKLGLPGVAAGARQRICGKRSFSEAMESRNYTIPDEDITNTSTHEDLDKFKGPIVKEKQMALSANDPPRMGPPPPSKAQVVGWPPVRDFRKVRTVAASNSLYVKVSMDGAPYLRKVDLKLYSTYHELTSALEKMFSCLIIMGKCGSLALNESNLMDLPNGSEYVPTYEDKDGDWMLIGDVPWQMFVDSCQRMRIMTASEAIGLAPRTMENCKNRNRVHP